MKAASVIFMLLQCINRDGRGRNGNRQTYFEEPSSNSEVPCGVEVLPFSQESKNKPRSK